MSVGIDIVQISRIQKAMQNPNFADKILTCAEKNQGTHNNIQSTAASFAAKEAFSKALGTGMRGFGFEDISVLHDGLGKPYLQFSPIVESMLRAKGVQSCRLSLSHEKEYAIATVILEHHKSYSHYNSVMHKFDANSDSGVITPQMMSSIIPKRHQDMHKGDCGRLFVLAGSRGLTGAGIMSSKAALRSGAGLITLGCAAGLNSIFECAVAEVMTMPLDDTNGVINCNDMDKIIQKTTMSDCVLAGPGLTANDDIAEIVRQLVNNCTKTLVLDADGINVLGRNINIPFLPKPNI
ncbi:MAG: holo-ACP synthase [Clostridia bacterium]|nr:holo-ACP synthase [Clostridia bacterium]